MKLVFMGTPEAAVPTLRRCVEDGHEVLAVWTQPDRPAGRGNKLTAPPVKGFALTRGLAVYQPTKIKTDEAKTLFASHDADAVVVVAYGRILPPAFLQAPRRGCINVHFSLLPKYRGAAPVNWAIAHGETETGVTTMQMDEGLDTGPILLQRATLIKDAETAPQLLERLAVMGAELLSETLTRLDEVEPRAQNEDEATLAPILKREDGRINWSLSAAEIERRVRGFQSWPGAYSEYDLRRLVVWQARAYRMDDVDADATKVFEPGEVIAVNSESFVVACGKETALRLLEVQLEGKRRMSAREFLNGVRVRVSDKLG